MKRLSSLLKNFFENPEYVFVIPALVFSLLSAFLMPQLVANDEPAHFLRGYELTEFKIGEMCNIPKNVWDRAKAVDVDADYTFSTTELNDSDTVNKPCGQASSYNILMHIPESIGIAIAKFVWPTIGGMILFGRITNALFYCTALFFIIRKARLGKWLLAVIGLMPTIVHGAGSLTGDTVNNVIILGFITYIFNLFIQKTIMSKKQIIILFVMSILLATTKITNLVLLLPILFLPNDILPVIRLRSKRIPKNLLRLIAGAICGILAIATVVGWTHVYGSSITGNFTAVNQVAEKPYRFLKILFNTYVNPDIILGGVSYGDWLLRGTVGSFASFKYHLPYGIVYMIVGLLTLIGFKKSDSSEKVPEKVVKTFVMSTTVAMAIVVLAMTYGLYSSWAILPWILGENAQFAFGLQGRYFTPLILLLLPTFIYLRRFISIDIKKGVTTGVLVFSVMTFSLIFYMVQTVNFVATLPI